MKKYLTTLLLGITLIIGEIHTFWERGSQKKVNWIIKRYEPMTVQWNVKFVCDELNIVIYFVAMILFVRNRINKTSVVSFIYLAVADMALYFWNFKTYDYHYLYLTLFVVWPMTFYLLKFKR